MLIEGLVRVVSTQAYCASALEVLVEPIMAQLQHIVQTILLSPPPPTNNINSNGCQIKYMKIAIDELRCLSTVLRFLDAPSEAAGGLAVTKALLETRLWPILERLPPRFAPFETAMEALMDLFGSILKTKSHSPLIFDRMSHLVLSVYSRYPYPCILDWAMIATEVDPTTLATNAVVSQLIRLTFQHVGYDTLRGFHDLHTMPVTAHANHAIATVNPDLLRSFFELVHRISLFAPQVLFPTEEPPQCILLWTLEVAIACFLEQTQREALRAVLVCCHDTPLRSFLYRSSSLLICVCACVCRVLLEIIAFLACIHIVRSTSSKRLSFLL